ncbi:MAG: hypothetical protein NWQ43_10465 [Dolichospermum sp.]|nr:hypothetical protein [Dolichospermum sp.]
MRDFRVRSQESGVRSSGVRSQESGVWLTPRFAIRSMANATLRYQEEEGRKKNFLNDN